VYPLLTIIIIADFQKNARWHFAQKDERELILYCAKCRGAPGREINPLLGIDFYHSVFSQERQNVQNSWEFINGDAFASTGTREHDIFIV
jgi:hypothetical protein